MIRPQAVIKNRCEGCNKFLLMHNKIMSCETCEKTVHSHCAKNIFEYNQISDCWQCCQCILTKPPRYNPFASISYDKHDPVHLDEFEDLAEIRRILDNCSVYDTTKFKNLVDLHNINKEGQNLI